MKTYVLSLGGSLIFPDKINSSFLKEFRELIISEIKKGKKFIIICGGGAINRQYNAAASEITEITPIDDEGLDWIGIAATRMNASFVRELFGDVAHNDILDNPTKKMKTSKSIIIGCGWKPGCSSDKDAVLAAKTFRADMVINLTNIDYVYTKDPRTNHDAKKIEEMTWKKFREIVGDRWTPKLNSPFDPIAAQLAQKMKLKVIITKGDDLENLRAILNGKKFKGTVII
jgi:uridylate kinase